jgi:hypothetical protein
LSIGKRATRGVVLHDIADEISGADTLDHVWIEVDDARIHVRMSRQPPRSLALPPIVLIHGIGVSGRYLLPTAVIRCTTRIRTG